MRDLHAGFVFLILFLLAFGATDFSAFATSHKCADIEIISVDYLIENIHPSYWDGAFDPESPRLYFNIYISIKDLKENLNLLQEVRVYDMYNNFWTIDLPDQANLDLGYLGGMLFWYDKVLSKNSTLLTIKDLTIRITTTDGKIIKYPLSLAEPGAAKPSSTKFIFAEPYRGRTSDFHTPALKLGIIQSVILNEAEIKAKFTIEDPRVANGCFQFFDEDRHFIGESPRFINSYSGEFLASLNNGNVLHLNNMENLFTLALNEIEFTDGLSAADISYIQLLLTDGGQFAETNDPTNFYYTSRSEMIPVESTLPLPEDVIPAQNNQTN